MIQTTHSMPLNRPNSKKYSESYRQMELEDSYSQRSQEVQDNTFMQRFKNNQHDLKNKFRRYLKKQKVYYPFKHLKVDQIFQEDEIEKLNARKLRKEKNELIDQLNHSMNETKYYLHRNQQYEKTCTLLERRMRKVEELRRSRKSEVIKLEHDLKSIHQEINEEKQRYWSIIRKSSKNSQKSKDVFCQKNFERAKTVRCEKQLHRSRIYQQKQESHRFNQLKRDFVRRDEEKVSLNVTKVLEEKKDKAQDVKLERLFRELAEKEDVKIKSSRVKEAFGSKIIRQKEKTIVLEGKIKEYRKSLGEKWLVPKIAPLKLRNHRRHYTEENEFSTKSGFLSENKHDKYESEAFDDY